MSNFCVKPYPSLTAVAHRMVLRAPSGLDAKTVAEVTGYAKYSTMMSELSRQPGHKLGADMLLPLMDAADSNAPVTFLARERGGIFLLLPEPAQGGSDLVQGLADAIKTFGEYAASAAERIADGDIDPDEMVKIDRETSDVMEAVLSFRKLARATHDARYGVKHED